MRHYLRLFARTFDISVSVMLMYRANVVFFLIFETLFLGSQFLTVSVGYQLAGADIAGWTREQAFLLTAVNGLSHQVFICFFINAIFSLGVQVWNGQFDYVLLKPLHPLLSTIFNGQFVVSNLPNLLINLGAVVYFLIKGAHTYDLRLLPAFAALTVIGMAVRVGLALLCIAPVFFSERLADVESSFWSLASLGRYPLSVYPRVMELVLTFLLPIGMLASVPSAALYKGQGLTWLVGSAVAAASFVGLCGWAFMTALKRYQSVNSGV